MDLGTLLNPPQGLSLSMILLISFILGLLHGATPDEHTWPITFSYAIGSYSSLRGAKAGISFSAGFTVQRAFLTTLGFLGLAAVYREYNLDGPVYVVVGIVMVIAGSYVLKGRYLHLPFDSWLHRGEHRVAHGQDPPFPHGAGHHSSEVTRRSLEETHVQSVPTSMAAVHGLIAGFGFGAYATIITFILAPQVPSLLYAPLPGVMFGLGTMVMQVIFGAVFASFARLRKLSPDDVCYLGRHTGGETLYWGGMLFAAVGAFVVLFPSIESIALSTGNPIPNLDAIGLATVLVLLVVGGIGGWSLVQGLRQLKKIDSGAYCHPPSVPVPGTEEGLTSPP